MDPVSVHYSSATPEWYTPEHVLDLVRQVAPIGLDPCSSGGRGDLVAAVTSWGIEDDGLSRDWCGHGLVYCNPPYGRQIGPWVQKCAEEVAQIVALVPARTDTRWFHDHVWNAANAICFWKGRLKFLGAPVNAPFPSAVAYYGNRSDRFKRAFDGAGRVVVF